MPDAAIQGMAASFRKPDTRKVKRAVEDGVRELFPDTPADAVGKSIHFVASKDALTAQMSDPPADVAPEFLAMRNALFERLKR